MCLYSAYTATWDCTWPLLYIFFLPILCSVNSDHDNRVGVWHISFKTTTTKKKKKKKKVLWHSHSHQQIKTIYIKSLGEGIHTYPLPNPRIVYFGLKPINCLSRDSFGCKAIPSCNCPGEKELFRPSVYALGRWYWKGWDLVLLLSPQATDRYLLLSIIAKLLWILQNRVREACCRLSCRVGHWSSSNISPTWLWLRQRLQVQRAAVLWTFSILPISFWWWGIQTSAAYSSLGRIRESILFNVWRMERCYYFRKKANKADENLILILAKLLKFQSGAFAKCPSVLTTWFAAIIGSAGLGIIEYV